MIRDALARFKCDTRGVAAVEFGIVIVPLLLFMFGIIEFSRAYWAKEALQQTAVNTARCMGLGLSTSGCTSTSGGQAYAVSIGNTWGLTIPTSNVTITTATTCGGVSGFVTVHITYTFKTVVPDLIAGLFNDTLYASACFPSGNF
ncbi:MAG TPA: TadE family protein [Methylocystis sp.]|jgi:Flp pilus assembly protein TadG